MAEQLMSQLQEAAQIILAPPNLFSTELRRSAEEVFLNFRKLPSPYELCLQILETHTNDYILFEAVGLIKIALIREWTTLSPMDISSLRDYLLLYVINKPNLPSYVKGAILQVIAIIIKRGNVNDSGQARHCILGEVKNLIMTGDLPKKILGCNLISAIIQEYEINSKSASMGLSSETYFEEMKIFQATDLKRIFKYCIGVIDELIKTDLQEDSIIFLKHLLPILESIFTWNFDSDTEKFLGITFDPVQYELLWIDTSWQDIIMVPAVLDLMFMLYWKIRGNPQLAHHVRTCLVQMANTYIKSKERKLQYITNYLERFLKFITSVDIIDEEASGIASIIEKIFTTCGRNITALPEDILKPFLEQVSRLTCMFLENAAQEEWLTTGECLYTEAVDILFYRWLYIFSEKTLFSSEFIKQNATQIFNIYLWHHISPPEGIRNIEDKDLEKEELDIEDNDRVKFKEHLQIIGSFARQVPNYTLPLLAQLIEDRTSKLREHLNKSVEYVEPFNPKQNNSIARLYEDIHWLILMVGNILCMESDGEVALIPPEIMKYDMEQVQEGKVDMDRTMQFLVTSKNVSSPIDVPTESVDHVIRLIADIFRLCTIEKIAISVQLDSILSPELSCTIIWFLHRWTLHYLIPIEYHYSEISIIFLQTFGEDTPGASWATDFLLEKIECNINAFKGEAEVMKETIALLISLVETEKRASYVLKSQRFECIINLAVKGPHELPQIVKRGLMQAVVQAAVSVRDKIDQSYWRQTLQPLLDRFKQIISNEKFEQCYQQEEFKIQLEDTLERFIGVAQGARGSEVGLLYHYIQPVLCELPKLISLYHNYPEIVQLIWELLYECTKGPDSVLRELPQTEAAQVSDIYLSAIRNYGRYNTNRLTTDSTAEEDNYQDILLLMKMLTNFVQERIFEGETVFLNCLAVIMPMMTVDLLKFPTFCFHYWEMIQPLCTLRSTKIFDLSPELLQPLLASIELGLLSFDNDMTKRCCCIVNKLALHIVLSTPPDQTPNQIMVPFLNILLNIILTNPLVSNFILYVREPFYWLILSYRDEYNRIVQNILSIQSNQQMVEKLTNAFTKLNQGIDSSSKSVSGSRGTFDDYFDEFISDVQSVSMNSSPMYRVFQ